ncbi:MAG: type IV pilus modification PilV family protein [Limisphaerales bacterium]
MVITQPSSKAKQRGTLMAEMIVAMGVLVIAMLPLAFSATSDARQLRTTYQKAIAREILDGEIELLAAGEWQHVPEGIHEYVMHANAATNLPPGEFRSFRTANVLRLEWRPAKKMGMGTLVREVKLK